MRLSTAIHLFRQLMRAIARTPPHGTRDCCLSFTLTLHCTVGDYCLVPAARRRLALLSTIFLCPS